MSEKRVLVIDDVSIIRAYVRAALKDEHVVVAEASTAHLGLDSHASMPADLIICDVNMPQMNGVAFLQRLREADRNVPVIMLTAEGDKGVVGNLVKLGIQGYLLKPFKPAVLAARVNELIRPQAAESPTAGVKADSAPDPCGEGAGEQQAAPIGRSPEGP